MKLLKIPMMLLIVPLLCLLQIALAVLDRVSGFCSGLLVLLFTGFLIYHSTIGNRDNMILLFLCLAICIGIPAVLQIVCVLLKWFTNTITA